MTSLDLEAFPPQALAMRLNNRGALCIETGRFDRAISTLVRALRLSEQAVDETICTCNHCSLDECMSISNSPPQRRHLEESNLCGPCQTDNTEPGGAGDLGLRPFKRSRVEEHSTSEGFVYQRPIRISPQSMLRGHSPGVTLSLIIIFNLGLAHHLSAIQQHNNCKRRLQKALQLYELAYQLQLEELEMSSLRFTIIMANNLSQIHRVVENHSKYQMCLEHLLSTLMYLVDCRVVVAEQLAQMDGFFENASQLILKDRCAGAA